MLVSVLLRHWLFFSLRIQILLRLPVEVACALTIQKLRLLKGLRCQMLTVLALFVHVLLHWYILELLIKPLLLLKLAVYHPPGALYLS